MTTPIIGYRELTQDEVELINVIKERGKELGLLVTSLRERDHLDQRWISIGATHLQEGLMALTRGIAQPTTF